MRYSYRMDHLAKILERVDEIRSKRPGLSDNAISLAATNGASKDLIRNWRRAVDGGKKAASARVESVRAVATALGVSEGWLMTGEGRRDALSDQELELLSAFRQLPEERRSAAVEAALAVIRLASPTDEAAE